MQIKMGYDQDQIFFFSIVIRVRNILNWSIRISIQITGFRHTDKN